MIDPRQTRGYLNNNPGNLDRSDAFQWDGEVRDLALCTNDVQRMELTHGRFCVFLTPPYGIRAMAKNLLAYRDRLGCRTIRQFINRWAPPNENNTASYIANVAYRVAVGADDPVDIANPSVMRAVIDAIIRVECAGMPYQGDEVNEGMRMAGIAAEQGAYA